MQAEAEAAFTIAVLLLAQAEMVVVELVQVTVLAGHLVPQIRAVAEVVRLVAVRLQPLVDQAVLVL